jgi:hypothetical protein
MWLARARPDRSKDGRGPGRRRRSVREVLHRELYRGRRIWNKTKKRDTWGQDHRHERPEVDWVTLDEEDLRIVAEPLWRAARERIEQRADVYRRWVGAGKQPGATSRPGASVMESRAV